MNKRNLRLEKYGISGKRYKELCGFCEQYPEWKNELKEYPFLSAVQYSDMPKSPNVGVSDKTAEIAIDIESLLEKCRIIEETAKEADPEMWQFIIKSVCYEVPLGYLQTDGMFLEKSAFYERRRYFFFLLDKVKK